MYTSSEPAVTTTPNGPSPSSPPQSPSRIGRLRGFSYLRNYTQHLHSRSDSRLRDGESRQTQSKPTPPASPASPSHPPVSPGVTTPISPAPSTQPGPTAIISSASTSGWTPAPVPAVAADSSVARVDPHIAQVHILTSSTEEVASAMTRNSSDQMAGTKEVPHLPSIRFIPHNDPRAARPSLSFQAVSRTLPLQDSIIRVGRYSERDAQPGDIPRNIPSAAPVGFKSKVVSRRHCEFWYENAQWFIKDVKSSSGTFLNHLRLSPPGVESRPWPINDGDVVQLGIDFRGGEEMIFRCVKIRIELNRGWQKALNNFNKSTHNRLRKLAEAKPKRDSDTASLSSSECAICLMAVAPCQSLFVAPCSHVWHYKCIRPILNGVNYPHFLCPNCRAVADLEADIEEAESDWEEDLQEAIAASKQEKLESAEAKAPASQVNGTASRPIVIDDSATRDGDGDSPMPDAIHAPPDRPAPPAPPTPAPQAVAAAEANSPPAISNPSPLVAASPAANGTEVTAALPIPPRNVSPGTRRYDLMTHGPTEGPMTPRNDAGPFVLDGGAGIGRESHAGLVPIENKADKNK